MAERFILCRSNEVATGYAKPGAVYSQQFPAVYSVAQTGAEKQNT